MMIAGRLYSCIGGMRKVEEVEGVEGVEGVEIV